MSALHDIAQKGLQALMNAGADSASCRVSRSELREFTVDAGKFSLLRTTLDNSLAMTAIKDHKRGVISTNDLSDEALGATALDCLAAAEASQADTAWALSDVPQDKAFTDGTPQPDLDKLLLRSRELLDTIHREYPKVMVEQMITSHQKGEVDYVNSHGVHYEETEGYYGLSLMFSGHEGDKAGSFNGGGVMARDLETPFIEQGGLRQSLKDAENQIHTQPTEGKFEGTMILTPPCVEDFLGMLLGNYVADGVLLDGTSQWKDKLGQSVADPRLTISVAPSHEAIVCGEKYTGEGFLSEDYDVIRNGVLEQFMLSYYVANKTGLKRAPNASGSLIVAPGDTALADLVKGVKKGVMVSRFSGGAPGTNGEFSGVAKNAFLIEDGRIAGAITETMISGNLAGMLNNLRGISRERVASGYNLLPWIAVDGITISGK